MKCMIFAGFMAFVPWGLLVWSNLYLGCFGLAVQVASLSWMVYLVKKL